MTGEEPVVVTASAERSSRGARLVLAATAFVGIAGYLITWLVPRVIGVAAYSGFAVFWAAVFLVAAALSGIQQEITRASAPGTVPAARPASPLRFGLGAAAAVVVVIAASSPVWAPVAFPRPALALPPLVVGAAGYVAEAVVAGLLYGSRRWGAVFFVIAVEGIARLVLVAAVLAIVRRDPVPALLWAVVLPFPLTALAVGLASRRALVGHALDVAWTRLAANALRTVVAAGSMGLLVSGFPFLLGVTTSGVSADRFGTLVLLATLTRAPLIVVGMALQSFLVVMFSGAGAAGRRLLARLVAVVAALGIVLAVGGLILGPPLWRLLFPGEAVPSGALVSALAGSSALLGAICVAAPAVLARGRHGAFTVGWLVAAVATALLLTVPSPFEQRVVVALVAGPAAGLVVHLVGALAPGRRL